MPTFATKLPEDLGQRIKRAAAKRGISVSAFLRKAAENELSQRSGESFASRYRHLIGSVKGLPPDASMKEGYED